MTGHDSEVWQTAAGWIHGCRTCLDRSIHATEAEAAGRQRDHLRQPVPWWVHRIGAAPTTAVRLPTDAERAARWRDIALTRPGYATYPDTRPGPQRRVQLPAVSWAHRPDPRPLADIRPARPLLPTGGPDDAVTLPRVGGAVTVVWQRPETGPDLDALARSHAGEGPTKGSTTSDALRGSQAAAPSRRWWDPRTWGRR